MEKQVEIKVKPDGSINIELIGFEGEGCSKTAQRFIEALGKSVFVNRKSEYYNDNNKADNCQRNQSGF